MRRTKVERTDTRYNVRALQKVIALLENWIEQTEETLGNAEEAGNDNRADMLQSRLESLEEARDALESIVNA
jgi:DNA-binding ferritin-like protein